jgi:hypothetical protein
MRLCPELSQAEGNPREMQSRGRSFHMVYEAPNPIDRGNLQCVPFVGEGMRTIACAVLLLTLVAAPEALRESEDQFSNAVERSFAPGGTVQLDLSAGDYRLTSGTDNRVRVGWHTLTAEQLAESKVSVTVRGKEAEILTSGPRGPGRSDFRVEIELPRRSDLRLRMTAGDLSIAGIDGHKDVKLRAGDLTIEVDDPTAYGLVDAWVTAGDITARPFGFSTGGLFRKFAHTGPGRYELRASLWAGDLKLIPKRAADLGVRK